MERGGRCALCSSFTDGTGGAGGRTEAVCSLLQGAGRGERRGGLQRCRDVPREMTAQSLWSFYYQSAHDVPKYGPALSVLLLILTGTHYSSIEVLCYDPAHWATTENED